MAFIETKLQEPNFEEWLFGYLKKYPRRRFWIGRELKRLGIDYDNKQDVLDPVNHFKSGHVCTPTS